ncbi:MAG: OmpH family outer membrane protein [Deltaproteobacteria bacterium]|nr:MAG: OmpH family outer membrane protein [Deltaproteobacteria bacterium]
MRKWVVLSALIAIVVFVVTSVRAEELRIAVIDVNRVLNECAEGKAAKEKMKDRYKELQSKLEKEQDKLKKFKEEIDKNKIVLGEEKVKEKEAEFRKKMEEFRKLVAESEKEMRDRESTYTKEILKKIRKKVDAYVKENGIDLVLDVSGGVVYAKDSLDISDKIKEILDREYRENANKGK